MQSFKGENLPERAIERILKAVERAKANIDKGIKIREASFGKAAERR